MIHMMEAIVCIVEEKKQFLGRFLSSPAFNDASTFTSESSNQSNKSVLRLKGRIYVRHIKRITPNTSGKMSLTIEMENERLDFFIPVFKNHSALDKRRLHGCLAGARPPQHRAPLTVYCRALRALRCPPPPRKRPSLK